jgi:hypothetical protein
MLNESPLTISKIRIYEDSIMVGAGDWRKVEVPELLMRIRRMVLVVGWIRIVAESHEPLLLPHSLLGCSN